MTRSHTLKSSIGRSGRIRVYSSLDLALATEKRCETFAKRNRSVRWTIIVPHALGGRFGPMSNWSSPVSESRPNCQPCCTSSMSSLYVHLHFANQQHKQRKKRKNQQSIKVH